MFATSINKPLASLAAFQPGIYARGMITILLPSSDLDHIDPECSISVGFFATIDCIAHTPVSSFALKSVGRDRRVTLRWYPLLATYLRRDEFDNVQVLIHAVKVY